MSRTPATPGGWLSAIPRPIEPGHPGHLATHAKRIRRPLLERAKRQRQTASDAQQPSVSRHTARTDTDTPRIAGRADGGDLNIERGIAAAGAALCGATAQVIQHLADVAQGFFSLAHPLSLCRRSLRLSISRVRLMSLASSLASRTKSCFSLLLAPWPLWPLAVAVWRWLGACRFPYCWRRCCQVRCQRWRFAGWFAERCCLG